MRYAAYSLMHLTKSTQIHGRRQAWYLHKGQNEDNNAIFIENVWEATSNAVADY